MTNGSSIVCGKVGTMTWCASGKSKRGMGNRLFVLHFPGILTKGCTSSTISNCYGMYLTSNGSAMLDTDHLDSPRQRNEWHFPTLASGQSFSYSWKQYLDSTTSSNNFFHLMQVFGLSESNPIVALDALSGNLTIVDFSNTNRSCGSLPCPSTPLSNYFGKYTTHTIS
jgi:hypothetical protein